MSKISAIIGFIFCYPLILIYELGFTAYCKTKRDFENWLYCCEVDDYEEDL